MDLNKSLALEVALIKASKDSFYSFGYLATIVLTFWFRLSKKQFL
jgi:hypothetical protein